MVRARLVAACRRLDSRGLIAGAEGNLSARLRGGKIAITPSGMRKADVRERDLLTISADGALSAGQGRGARPSSEMPMHLAIYAARPDVRAIVHAHPPAATGFAVAGKTLPRGILAELDDVLGDVPLAPFRRPGSGELGSVVAQALGQANVALLARHGAVAVGPSVDAALNLMESLEQAARIVLAAHILQGITDD